MTLRASLTIGLAASLAAVVRATAQTFDTAFTVTLTKVAKSVHLAGSFNNWSPSATPLRLTSGQTWTVSLPLNPGKYHYKFVIDGGEWITDPKAVKNEDDGNGNINSVLYVWPPDYDKPAATGDGTVSTSLVTHFQEPPALNWDKGKLRLTVRLRQNDVAKTTVAYTSKVKGVLVSGTKDLALKSSDEFTATLSTEIPWDKKSPVRYLFKLNDGGEPYELDRIGVRSPRMKRATVPFTLDPKTFNPLSPPQWVERSVVYQIFPDRFANGDTSNDPKDVQPWNGEPTWFNWFGGDLAGVRKHLPHLQSLGVGCVYFNPVFAGPSNHRYEATDYKKIDWRLGTNQEFAQLTRDMHRRGIKTVLDGVFNHTAVDFFAFDDIVKKQQQSRYLNWYTIKSFPVAVTDPPPYEAWFGFRSMPKLNPMTPGAKEYLLSVPEFWAKNATIAGWRLDVANEVTSDYWRLFRQKVKALDKDAWIVGEIWGDGSPWLRGDQFDSVMNYQFRNAVLGFVAQGRSTPTQFWDSLLKVHDGYGPQVSRNMMNLLSSHDTPRILTECGGDARLARLAAMVQFMWIGAPCVYYGDELGMAGGRDPENRRGMEWHRATADNPFLACYRALSALRNGNAALQSGEPRLVAADDTRHLLVFRRELAGQWALVAVNRSDAPQTVTVPSSSATRGATLVRFTNESDAFSVARTALGRATNHALPVAPRSVTVLLSATKGRPNRATHEVSPTSIHSHHQQEKP